MSPEISDLFYRCVHMLHGNFKLDRQHAGSVVAAVGQNYDIPEGVFIGPLSAQPEEIADLLAQQPGLGFRLLDPTTVSAVGVDIGNLSFARVDSTQRELLMGYKDVQFFNRVDKTPIAKHRFSAESVISGRETEKPWGSAVADIVKGHPEGLWKIRLDYVSVEEEPAESSGFVTGLNADQVTVDVDPVMFLAISGEQLEDWLREVQDGLDNSEREGLVSVWVLPVYEPSQLTKVEISVPPRVVENSVGEQRATLYLKNLIVLNEALREYTLRDNQVVGSIQTTSSGTT